ncbi:repressor LexA [Pseudomonas sp. BW16M2]|uniref:LexA repressor n=1 Tax=Pseudomonas peradeniyensis TaxID=2745488 RepID=A0ABT2V902_9PSED|nr:MULTISPECIES: transcriptional repressor LexA [Pseudomonas]KNX77972.1 LexA family transcriptional regulator [Pseudomonas sp. 250J]MBC3437117.1 repressor LexA [Pseudomonas sp. BW16M2]MCU7238160.1 transcriptional repressor LexA [Pseudomonas peradeniyensis]MCU7280400.1 transcriptional repressor LexA [Pseudomonas peradeniyensis]QZA56666.1 transcriptional repressor LexA [Pseudomonas sp. 2hn]
MYSMDTLSPKRRAILGFIRERITDQGQPPSLADIAERFGFASRSVARKHITALSQAGFIDVTPNQARGIRLAEPLRRPEILEIPVLGQVAAGAPIGPDLDIHEQLLLDPSLFRRTPDYLLKVRGDSMIDDGIFDGDLVGIRQQGEARDGQIVVARLDGEVTIKRLQRTRDGYRLLPRNPAYAPIDVTPGHEFFIEGVFCGLLRRD